MVKSRKCYTLLTSERENGFTIIELIIVVLVLGVLAATATTVYMKQQREAIAATVKHDTKSNVSVMTTKTEGKLYAPVDVFLAGAAQTDENIVSYTVNATRTEACTHTVREISEDDVVVWRMLSSVGEVEPEFCPDLVSAGHIVGGTVNNGNYVPATPATPNPEAGEDEDETNNYDGSVTGNPFYPGNPETVILAEIVSNTLNQVQYKLTITTTEDTPALWVVNTNKNTVPMNGNHVAGISDSRFTQTTIGEILQITGTAQLAKASKTSPVIMNLWIESPGTLPVVNANIPSNSVAKNMASGGAWYGTQNFTVKNTSQFFTGWTTEVDLTDLRALVSSRPTQTPVVNHSNLTITHLHGNIYKVESNHRATALYTGNEFTFTIQIG